MLPRALNLEADGSVACDVVAVMPPDRGCDVDGFTAKLDERGLPVTEDGRAVCVVRQLVPESRAPGAAPPPGTGWYYDTFTADGRTTCGADAFQRIAFTGAQPPSGAVVRLECFVPVSAAGGIGVGTFCDPAASAAPENPCPSGTTPEGGEALACDPVLRTCGARCDTNADCRTAGLIGFVCDGRALGDVDPEQFAGDATPYGFCVNPTCS
ncbi:MAG: hypothetical protein M5U28_04275 [Sandaracinaceae bacterium]|nr:hypothetical protein [Sandaracinaceae bacterium]